MTIFGWIEVQWNAVPAPARAWFTSFVYSLQGLTVAATGIGYTLGSTNGGFNDWNSYVVFMSKAWFGIMLGAFFGIGPYVHANVVAKNGNGNGNGNGKGTP